MPFPPVPLAASRKRRPRTAYHVLVTLLAAVVLTAMSLGWKGVANAPSSALSVADKKDSNANLLQPVSSHEVIAEKLSTVAPSDAAAEFAIAEAAKKVVAMPYKYPMHAKLPKAVSIVEHLYRDQLSRQEKCWSSAANRSIFTAPPVALRREVDEATSRQLSLEYAFVAEGAETFFAADSPDPLTYSADDGAHDTHSPWWAPKAMDVDSLPCTSEVQARLYELQHPTRDCSNVRYLVTKLKEGAHGVGSALTLVAHDLLSAIIVGRVLQVQSNSKWYFSSPHCAAKGRGGWECFFGSVATCKAQGAVEIVSHRRQALRSTASVIVKKGFDIDGLSRNDIPSEELFFGDIRRSQCFHKYKKWVADPSNVFIQGTFERGADPALYYMLSQAMRYLLRNPQPWVRRMLRFHFPQVGLPAELIPSAVLGSTPDAAGAAPSAAARIYVQERGEIAKFREYYNVFGCHNVNNTLFVDVVSRWCQSPAFRGVEGSVCSVYVSGNTPYKNFQWLEGELKSRESIQVLSTWKHRTLAAAATAESERWGASSPASSWVDLFAGVASTNWICIVQSNWCRVINFLRLTAGRAQCGFIDGGALMIASPVDREKYCIVGPYPTKAFSNRLK